MTALLELRENLKKIYSRNEAFILPVIKFLLSFIVLSIINGKMGYMTKLDNMAIVLIVSLLCSFLPTGFMAFFAMMFAVLHMYALSIETAAVGLVVFLLLYLLFPNGVQLRPETIAGDNIAASLMQMVWAVDTSTNVCPSIHVSTTVAIFLAVRRSRIWQRRSLVVGGCGVLAAFICLSTVFLKQHSVIDVLCGIALTLVLHLVVSRLMARSQLTLQSGQAERVSISRG